MCCLNSVNFCLALALMPRGRRRPSFPLAGAQTRQTLPGWDVAAHGRHSASSCSWPLSLRLILTHVVPGATTFSVAVRGDRTRTAQSCPTHYRLARRSGARHEGSTAAVGADVERAGPSPWPPSQAARCRRPSLSPGILGVMGLVISIGFIAIHRCFTSNPFLRHSSGAAGRQRPQPAAAGSRADGICIRRCSTWDTSASRSPSPSPIAAQCSRGASISRWVRWSRPWTNIGLGLPDHRHRTRAAGGPTTSSAGAAGGSGTR